MYNNAIVLFYLYVMKNKFKDNRRIMNNNIQLNDYLISK